MKTRAVLMAGVALTLVGASVAQAGTKVMASAPALRSYPAGQTIYCDIVNLNTSDKNVTIDIMDAAGNVVSGPFTQLLAAGTGTASGDSAFAGSWCRFTVDGSTKKYRAMAIYDDASSYTITIPAY